MFTEIIKLTPQIDRSALNSMFANLNSRFTSVARKFGDGMKNALKIGGIVGIASALISKLVNPLQKAEEIIDRIINKGDDANTFAEEFNSDPGKLLRLEGVGKMHGVDAETMRMLIQKFQGALTKEQDAIAAPGRLEKKLGETPRGTPEFAQLAAELKAAREEAAKGGILHEFVNEKDMVEAFFKFVQSLQKVDPAQKTVAQNAVFGERIRGKAAEFFNTKDFAADLKRLPSAQLLSAAAKKSGDLADLKDQQTAVRESEDFVTKSNLLGAKMINALDQSARLNDKGDNQTLMRFDALKTSSIAIQELTQKFDNFTTDFLNNVMPEITSGVKTVSKVADAFLPDFKTVKKFFDVEFTDGVKTLSDIYSFFTGENEKGGIMDRIKSPVFDPTDPFPIRFGHEVNAGLDQTIQSLSNDINGVRNTVQNIWDEFKSTRIYRTFGGGK